MNATSGAFLGRARSPTHGQNLPFEAQTPRWASRSDRDSRTPSYRRWPLDERGTHAGTCSPGFGVERRHGRLEDGLAGFVRRWLHHVPLTDKRMPNRGHARSRQPADSPDADLVERAAFDAEHKHGASRHWIDVPVRHPAAEDVAPVAVRRPGEAARRAERQKHPWYQGFA